MLTPEASRLFWDGIGLIALGAFLRAVWIRFSRAVSKRAPTRLTRQYARFLYHNKLMSMEELQQFYIDHPEK